MSTIRAIQDDDVEAVLDYIAACVARSGYANVFPAPEDHSGALMFAARARGAALAAFDDAGAVVGTIIIPVHDYMGSAIGEEVAWFAENHRDLLRLFDAGIRHAVQKGASVLKMSAPAGTDLGAFYERHGFGALETVFVKVVSHGLGHSRRYGSRPPGVVSSREGEEEERG